MTFNEKFSLGLALGLMFLGFAHAAAGIFNVYKFFRDARLAPIEPEILTYPGISILVPIKGPVHGLQHSVGALFDQDYPGPIEIILAFQDANDPSLPEARALVGLKNATSKAQGVILAGLPFLGLNPKNSNVVHSYRRASQPWLYISDVDTRIPREWLRLAMRRLQAIPRRVATAMTVHEDPVNLGACLEVIATNLELPTYFSALYNFKAPRQPLNGASQLVSKELFEKVGGPDGILNQITDDAYLEGLYFAEKAPVVLSPLLVRVKIPRQTVSGFMQRQIRWMSIIRHCKPDIYWIAPLFWFAQWSLLLALVTRDVRILGMSLVIFAVRILQSMVYQILLRAPPRDMAKSWALFIYDLLVPYLWLSGLLKKRLVWAGIPLRVQPGGGLIRSDRPR